MSKHPYWRWLRWQRKTRPNKGKGARTWNQIVVVGAIVALIATDQATKHLLFIEDPWHTADGRWLATALILMLPLYAALFSNRLRPGAIFLLAGALGNVVSVYLFGAAPNPFKFATSQTPAGNGAITHYITFNLADVFQYVGVALLVVGLFQIIHDQRKEKRCQTQDSRHSDADSQTQETRTTTRLDNEILAHFGS